MKGRGKSRDLPVHQILEILHKWGIHTLGQFAALEKEDLSARLGPEAVRLWERASGRATRLLKLVQPPESFSENFEFEHEIETVEPLLFMLRRFLQQLTLRLNAIYFVAKEITLQIIFADKKIYERSFKIPQPTNDVDLLFRMLHTHLEDFKSEQPIISVSLAAQPVKPARQQFGLFETALRDPNQLSETLARLTALLGPDRVGTPVVEETFRPDTFHLEPFTWQPGDAPVANDPLPRSALRRFRPNLPVGVLLDENEPAHIRAAQVEGEVSAKKGPYPISGNWWDEIEWNRIEWDVQLQSGVLARCHRNQNGWALDGVYD